MVVGKVYKLELEPCAVNFSLYQAEDNSIDTYVKLYKLNEANEYEEINYCDNDSIGYGENGYFSIDVAGTYYFVASGYDSAHDYTLTLEIDTLEDTNPLPDFCNADSPTSDDSGLWEWNPTTKILTLKDGLEVISIVGAGVCLPENSKIIVDGNVSIISYYEGIYGEDGLEIQLNAGSELVIESTNADGIELSYGDLKIKGTADSKGNLPTIKVVNAVDDGINAGYQGDLTIEEGKIILTNCDIDIVSDSEGIYTYFYGWNDETGEEVFPADGESFDLIATDCKIDITADEETIYVYNGDIIVEGGRIITYAEENALEATKITLKDVNYHIGNDGSHDLISPDDFTDFSLPGYFIILDIDYNVIYEGEWTDDLLVDDGSGYYYIGVYDEENDIYIEPHLIMSVVNGNADDNAVVGVDDTYEKGNKIEFEAIGGGADNEFPIGNDTRWTPITWEVTGTSLKGEMTSNKADFSTETLATGKYTLKVTFEKQAYSDEQGWVPIGELVGGEMVGTFDTVETEFTVTETASAPVPTPTPEKNPDIPNTSATATLPFGIMHASVAGIYMATKKKKDE